MRYWRSIFKQVLLSFGLANNYFLEFRNNNYYNYSDDDDNCGGGGGGSGYESDAVEVQSDEQASHEDGIDDYVPFYV